MKAKYTYKKKFKEIATAMGFFDKPQNVLYDDPITKKQRFMLINNHKRFVEGMLALPLKEQESRIKQFEELTAQLESDVAAGKIELNKLLKEAHSSEKSEDASSDPDINLGSD